MTGVQTRSDSPNWDWNVVVFCRNEQPYIVACIDAIADAMGTRRAILTIVVNGSSDDSAQLAADTARRRHIPFMLYTITHGDKANAINQFYYQLKSDARQYFFVDGYTRITPTAFTAMDACLTTRPEVVAATGFAMNGRTMTRLTPQTLNAGGKLHGQLHGLRRDFIDRLVGRGIRIPIGLYYGDGLIGSMAMHDLDPLGNPWEDRRIGGCADAGYEIPSLSLFRIQDLRRQYSRKIRQMRGRLENAAIRSIVYRHGYEGLPAYSDEMIHTFLRNFPPPPVGWADRPFMRKALGQIDGFQRPDPKTLEATLQVSEIQRAAA